jgi:hypothetical protein
MTAANGDMLFLDAETHIDFSGFYQNDHSLHCHGWQLAALKGQPEATCS